ncbi:MAG TPA: transposase [Rhodocyclaceae bacterium]|nr:transposase [Rhodocyclaceae bacterium]
MRYRRADAAGGTYFFTVNLADRRSDLLLRRIEDLRAAHRWVMHAHPFVIVAMVVLPEHLHAVWRLPPGDADYPLRWSLIKANFSRRQADLSAPAVAPNASAASGNAAIGNTRFATTAICNGMSITSISIRSSMVG